VRHSKDEIASADAASAQRKLDRIRAACTGNGVSDTVEICKRRLKDLDLSAEDIAAAR
jgi:hypothetical protein